MNKNNNRHGCNVDIVTRLSALVDMYPQLRFIQLLYASGIIGKEDKFYEESCDTLENLKDRLEE